MKALEIGDPGENPKEFYTSYPDWPKMTDTMKDESKKYFQKLTLDKQMKFFFIGKDTTSNFKSFDHNMLQKII